ncbi:MAG: hypothetical protein NTY63_00620 [Candidatus Bipolaricaulota bacterium]|nr:hypothetical protein [Candidatus Bipolaricaulota bacterium]
MQHRVVQVYALGGLLILVLALLCIGGCTEKAKTTPGTSTPAAPTATPPAAGSTAKPSAATASTPASTPPKAEPAGKPTTPAVKPAPEPVFLSSGQVLAWKRGGTTSSLCDHLTIYADGRAVATSCKGQGEVERGNLMLNEAQRNQLNEWLRTLKPLDREESGDTIANAVPGRLAIVGSGDRDATASDVAALRGFAASLFEQAVRAGLSVPAPSMPQSDSKSEVTF